MTTAPIDLGSRLPRGVVASAVVGMAAAAIAWLTSGGWPAFTSSYARLDQLSALTLGALTGAALLGARALRQRGGFAFALAAGALLGGVGSLAGASVLVFVHDPSSPLVFLAERIGAWALASGASALLLNWFMSAGQQPSWAHRRESVGLATLGGAIGGVIFTLPGTSDAWQAAAFLWFGAALGFAVCGPELWRARAVVEALIPRGQQPGLLALHEWPLHDGAVLALGEAQLGCTAGRIAVYPPAGGVIADGRQVREPRWIPVSAVLGVGRARYRIRVLQAGQ